jgi:CrcB protein
MALYRGPIDPDVGPTDRRYGVGRRYGADLPVLAAVTVGGMIGAAARYQAGVWWPTARGHFPYTTLDINVFGCALIGVLLVLVTDVFTNRRLLRPFLGTGVLGGFTTFSTYNVDIKRLLQSGHTLLAMVDLFGGVIAALVAVTVATRLTRTLVARSRA